MVDQPRGRDHGSLLLLLLLRGRGHRASGAGGATRSHLEGVHAVVFHAGRRGTLEDLRRLGTAVHLR